VLELVAGGVSLVNGRLARDGAVQVKAEDGSTVQVEFVGTVGNVTVQVTGSEQGPVRVQLTADQIAQLGEGAVNVQATSATDQAGNVSAASGSLRLTLDNQAPHVNIVKDDVLAPITKGDVTFTVSFNESLVGTVSSGHFSAVNGTVQSVVKLDDTTYKVMVRPQANLQDAPLSLQLIGNDGKSQLTDQAGNFVQDRSLADLGGIQRIDNAGPQVVSVSSSATAITNQSFDFTVTFNEPRGPVVETGYFDASNFTVTHGTVVGVSEPMLLGDGRAQYVVTVTPNTGLSGNDMVLGVKYQGNYGLLMDALGNKGTDQPDLSALGGTQRVDTVAPTVEVTADKSALKAGETATLTFLFSEIPQGFALADIGTTSGVVSNLVVDRDDPKKYTATLTPGVNVASAAASVSVSAASYTDAAGNAGQASTIATTIALDTLAPSLSISSDKSKIKANETATLTFQFSEVPQGFTLEDISATNGRVSNLAVDSVDLKNIQLPLHLPRM